MKMNRVEWPALCPWSVPLAREATIEFSGPGEGQRDTRNLPC